MSMDESQAARFARAGWTVFIAAAASVLLAWLLFYLIDLRNAFGLRGWIMDLPEESFFFGVEPFFFQHWFRNGGPAEIIQWLLLGGTALLSGFIAGRAYGRFRAVGAFWLILGIGIVLMLLEDAGDPRHTLRSYVQAFIGERDQGTYGTIFEALYFLVLAAFPIYAIARYGRILAGDKRVRNLIIVAFACYFLATTLSFAGSAFTNIFGTNFYTEFGGRLRELFVGIGDEHVGPFWDSWDAQQHWSFVSFFLMDSLVEESIEVVGAGAFMGAALLGLSGATPHRGRPPRS